MAVIPPTAAPAAPAAPGAGGLDPQAAAANAANAKRAAAIAAQSRKGGKSGMVLISSLGLFAMLAIGLGSPSLLVFMIIALAPTVAAILTDKDPEKHAAIAVGAMTLGAMIPLVLGQFTAKPSSGYNVLRDPFAWLSVYAAAGIGWGIHAAVPAISVFLSDMRADWRRKDLVKLQDDLADEWGQEVIGKKKTASEPEKKK
ncbi:MAG: hypothetical protein FJX55_19710 [Alphaproteobacteria bacterium]|nr:hypothetical protein [Alphaproteobacteria bacterium]